MTKVGLFISMVFLVACGKSPFANEATSTKSLDVTLMTFEQGAEPLLKVMTFTPPNLITTGTMVIKNAAGDNSFRVQKGTYTRDGVNFLINYTTATCPVGIKSFTLKLSGDFNDQVTSGSTIYYNASHDIQALMGTNYGSVIQTTDNGCAETSLDNY